MFFETLKRVKSIGQRHAGKVYTPQGFTHLIRMQFRDPGMRFHTEFCSKSKPGTWTIKGEYRLYDDEDGLPSIHITLVYSTRNKKLKIDQHNWSEIGFQMADIVTHEYVHQYHVRRRGYRYGPGYQQRSLSRYHDSWKDYLGCEDEILAHAFNVASESVVYNRTIEKTKTYRLYQRHFRNDQKVMLQLRKRAVKYLKSLEHWHEQNHKSRTRVARCI
jgi:hypothetical protein